MLTAKIEMSSEVSKMKPDVSADLQTKKNERIQQSKAAISYGNV